MLVQIDGNGDLKNITAIPHQTDFDRWCAGLSDTDYDAIRDEIANRIGDKEVNVSSFHYTARGGISIGGSVEARMIPNPPAPPAADAQPKPPEQPPTAGNG